MRRGRKDGDGGIKRGCKAGKRRGMQKGGRIKGEGIRDARRGLKRVVRV